MKGKLSILYVGSLNPRSNSFRRFKTLTLLGHEATGMDIDKFIYDNLFTRFHYNLNIGPGIFMLNRKLLDMIRKVSPDILWVDNKPFLTAATLKNIKKISPKTKIINLITDDPTGRYKSAWRLCLNTAYLYDCHFVQRIVNVEELKNYGAKRVEFCFRSYDPTYNRPLHLDETDYAQYHVPVGFIGTYESNREEYVAHLIQNGIPVSITGNGWEGGRFWKIIKPYYKGPSVYGDTYIKIINGMDIALHFLRHANRDEQDSRTFEIPACAVFMLAERSTLHEQFFTENEEAVFFDSKEELLEKVKYYLAHEMDRKQIAENGLKRSIKSRYDHEGRLTEVIRKIFI